jgi:hypothetical protein
LIKRLSLLESFCGNYPLNVHKRNETKTSNFKFNSLLKEKLFVKMLLAEKSNLINKNKKLLNEENTNKERNSFF